MLSKLRNGSRILDQHLLADGTYVVLAEWPAPIATWLPMVCWRARDGGDGIGDAFWGKYHHEALPSFRQRAGREPDVEWYLGHPLSGS